MNILFVHDHKFLEHDGKYYSRGGLPEDVLRRYLKFNNKLTIFARSTKSDKVSKDYSLIDLENVKFNTFKKNTNFIKINTRIELKKQLISAINKADFVIARGSYLGILAANIAREKGKKYMIEVVGCPWDAYRTHSHIGKFIAPFEYLKYRKEIYKSPYVIYVTESFLQKRYPTQGKSENCSNVIIESSNSSILDKRIKRLKTNKKIINIGTIGAIDVKYKGHETVFRVLKMRKDQGEQKIIYELVGGGNALRLKTLAENLGISDQIIFHGVKNRAEIDEWLDKIDMYVQPSYTEGLPRALIEAMNRALPCIGAAAGGIPELLNSDYIYKNDNKRVHSFNRIFNEMNTESLILTAEDNFKRSMKFDKAILEKKRERFIKQIIIGDTETDEEKF